MIGQHYYKEKLVKMGHWDLLPADSESWMAQPTNDYFRQIFGIGKSVLVVCTLDDGFEHAYILKSYFKNLYKRIDQINQDDPRALEKILTNFYPFKQKAKKHLPKISLKNPQAATNQQLILAYKENRDWCQRATVYDQFGWLAEDYWTHKMARVLTKKLGIKKNSEKYHQTLFALTKPQKISTTLEEKRAILKEVIAVKNKKQTSQKASKKMASQFGFMPIFAYGDPWDVQHYQSEIFSLLTTKLKDLKSEYNKLKNHTQLRNQEIDKIVKEYHISKKDLQIFIDFGLALDARNEAEYIVSLSGYYLRSLYKEMAKRLHLSVKQLRMLFEDEIIQALQGKLNPQTTIEKRGKVVAYGFDKKMEKRINFSPSQSKKLFKHLESYVKLVQGANENKGVCANIGKVQGIAKILTTVKDNHKVNQGDIMIAHATSVDSLPPMKKAAAFVTEIGGLTCHAAVVSREFGVPCIVSLKHATKNFKDGDLVEVNATKGTVKKLKK